MIENHFHNPYNKCVIKSQKGHMYGLVSKYQKVKNHMGCHFKILLYPRIRTIATERVLLPLRKEHQSGTLEVCIHLGYEPK